MKCNSTSISCLFPFSWEKYELNIQTKTKIIRDLPIAHSNEKGISGEWGGCIWVMHVYKVWYKQLCGQRSEVMGAAQVPTEQSEIPEVHFEDCRQFWVLSFPFFLLTYSFPLSHHFHLHSHHDGCTSRDYKYSGCCHTGNGVVTHRGHSLKQKNGKIKVQVKSRI